MFLIIDDKRITLNTFNAPKKLNTYDPLKALSELAKRW